MPGRATPKFPFKAPGVTGKTSDSLCASDEIRLGSLAECGLKCVAGVGYSRVKTTRGVPPLHLHPRCIEIHFCIRGSMTFEAEGGKYRCMPGNMFVTQPADLHHLVERTRGQRHYWLLLRMPGRGETLLDLPKRESDALCGSLSRLTERLYKTPAGIIEAFKELVGTWESEPADAMRTVRLKSLVLRILLRMADSAGASRGSACDARIAAAMRLIRENPSGRHSVKTLAATANLSESRFSHMFKVSTGLPPHAFVAQCRLEEAMRLLKETDWPVTRIAIDLGFATPRHLSAQFRQTYGIAPKDARALWLDAYAQRDGRARPMVRPRGVK